MRTIIETGLRSIASVCFLLSVVMGQGALAQESVPVRHHFTQQVNMKSAWLTTLRERAAAGDTERLATTVGEFLDDLRFGPTAATLQGARFPIACCDYKTNYYVVMFVSTNAEGKPALVHVLAHHPHPEGAVLPGLKGAEKPLYEIFVTEDPATQINGSYEIQRVEDPALKQLSDFVPLVVKSVVLPGAIATAGTGGEAMALDAGTSKVAPRPFKYSVTVSSVQFTHARGKLTGKHTVVINQPIRHLKSATALIAEQLRSNCQVMMYSASNSNKAGCSSLVTEAEKVAVASLDAEVCRYSLADLSECLKKSKADLAEAFKKFAVSSGRGEDEVRGVYTAFATALADPARITGTTTLENQPPQRISFGLATGYLAQIDAKAARPRTSVQNGKIAPSPFSRSISMAIVNLPLWGYDPTRFEPTLRERIKPFAGVAFGSHFGVTTGVSWSFTRTLSANVGFGRIWYDTPKADEQIDAAPINRNAPFELASANAWFVAVGFSLGK